MPTFKSKSRLARSAVAGRTTQGNASFVQRVKQVSWIRRCLKRFQPELQAEEEPISPIARKSRVARRKTNCFRDLSRDMDRLIAVDELQRLRSQQGKDEELHKFLLTHPFAEEDKDWAVNLLEEVERRQKKGDV